MNSFLNDINGFWKSLGPIGPCAVLFLAGCLLIVGFIFNWSWLYPSRYPVGEFSRRVRRALVLIIGIICIICSIVFYIFRDKLYWN
jgi:hypothetical protein